MRIVVPNNKILTQVSLRVKELELNWDNPISRGLMCFMIPMDDNISFMDISRPYLTPVSFGTFTRRKEASSTSAFLPTLKYSIGTQTLMLFSTIPSVGGYNVFMGGADSGGEISMGVSAAGGGDFAILKGGQSWNGSGYVLTQTGKLGTSLAITVGSFSAFYENGNLVGTNGVTPSTSNSSIRIGANTGGQNATTISNIAAALVWDRDLSSREIQSIHQNKFQLLKKRTRKLFISFSPPPPPSGIQLSRIINCRSIKNIRSIR